MIKAHRSLVPAYILAGGRSSRFGSDKARAVVGTTPLIQSVANSLAPATRSVTVVAQRAGQYHDLGLRTLGDLRPGMGPLGGLHTALADLHQPGWLALIACDWAGIRSEWLYPLMRAIRPGMQCVFYASLRPEPLFGLYHTDIAHTVRVHLGRDQRPMQDLIWAVPHRAITAPPDWVRARNINRRDDLRAYQEAKGASHA